MTGHNVGDLLNNAGITWGWFYADFTAQPGSTSTHAVCSSNYDVHYDPFQYYPSTVNPHHLPPTSTALIGRQGDQANHQYDLNSFSAALNAGNLPAVSFLKAPSTATGHPQDGSTLSEQTFLVDMVNTLQKSKYWPSMAIIITYDDSDGWYDHVMPPIVNRSNDPSVKPNPPATLQVIMPAFTACAWAGVPNATTLPTDSTAMIANSSFLNIHQLQCRFPLSRGAKLRPRVV
jgi:phospholipase C